MKPSSMSRITPSIWSGKSALKVIGILTEGMKDPEKFLQVANLAAELEKPIDRLENRQIGKGRKSGPGPYRNPGGLRRDLRGQSLSSTEWRGFDDLDDFIETVELFSKRKKLTGNRLGFIAPSGAECGLIADIAADTAMDLPEFSPKTIDRLKKVQSPFLSIRNPLNAPEQYTRNAEIFNECIAALLDDENVDILGLRLPLPRLREDRDVVNRFTDLVAASKRTDKLLIVFSRASVSLPEYWRQLLREHEIPFLLEYRKGFKALKSLLNYQHFIDRDLRVGASAGESGCGRRQSKRHAANLRAQTDRAAE